MKTLFNASYLLASFLVLLSCEQNSPSTNTQEPPTAVSDELLYSFVFVGCNRIDWKDTLHKGTNASTANLPELKRTFNEVSQLEPRPDFFFFLGDLVLGLNADTTILKSQLNNWVNQYQDSSFSDIPNSDIQMVAVPGNHEMLYYDQNVNGELPFKPALNIWQQYMSTFAPNLTLNRVGGADSLENLQTYSFSHLNTHFIMMNTDTYNSDSLLGQVPANWIKQDIESARADTNIHHIFLMGHKPAWVDEPRGKPGKTIDTAQVTILWNAMEENQVEAMLSAHSHQYYREQPNDLSYQIIAGNAGSPYVKHLDPSHQFFGYTHVSVFQSGKIILKSMGREIPGTEYLESIPDSVKTVVKDSIDISWGTTTPAWSSGRTQK
jgi:hypothetical protein